MPPHTTTPSNALYSFRIEPLRGQPFGAEVVGLDIQTADIEDASLIAALRKALLDHQVRK